MAPNLPPPHHQTPLAVLRDSAGVDPTGCSSELGRGNFQKLEPSGRSTDWELAGRFANGKMSWSDVVRGQTGTQEAVGAGNVK